MTQAQPQETEVFEILPEGQRPSATFRICANPDQPHQLAINYDGIRVRATIPFNVHGGNVQEAILEEPDNNLGVEPRWAKTLKGFRIRFVEDKSTPVPTTHSFQALQGKKVVVSTVWDKTNKETRVKSEAAFTRDVAKYLQKRAGVPVLAGTN